MSALNYVGWDIGGAHLKMARIAGNGKVLAVEQHATPLWQGLNCLEHSLMDVKSRLSTEPLIHSITTTGELADIFQNRAEGVNALLTGFCNLFREEDVRVYAGVAGLISIIEASNQHQQVASANWHASASFIANEQTDGIFIDIGSSTTDIIPFQSGKLCNRGFSDQERMRSDELLYTGIVRTPMMAVVSKVPFAGEWQSIAAEHFASMSDVYRITGELDESHDLMPAADNGEKQISDSVRRVARMLGRDAEDFSQLGHYKDLARYVAEEQENKISQALQRVISDNPALAHATLIGAGTGRFLVAKLATRHGLEYVDVERLLDAEKGQQSKAADCVTAVSVAQLRRMQG
ncbi:MAG: hypothetical protein HN764_11160 [Gammaproteobacteria bacterium]|jgi:(4-(4-[2-(gamma-L-glutamylamino)ethyl]phenoxymethyl)furan-2-yl)methanamine synthase|nr:hypothetical protein [Gammaproteobacteria bacterium]